MQQSGMHSSVQPHACENAPTRHALTLFLSCLAPRASSSHTVSHARSSLTPLLPTPQPARSAFADPGALNRAEWVKFVAVFFNKEVEANALFNTIEADYQRLNASARDAAAKAGRSRATVAWLAKAGDVATLSYAPFKAQLVAVRG